MNNPALDAIRAKTARDDHCLHLLTSLESLYLLEIAICYYLDNSLVLLCGRTFVQLLLVQARTNVLGASAPLVPVLTANIISIATHLLQSRPEATARSARGYLYGGLVIVFEGQLGPISKWSLVLQDLLIFGIQLLILCVSYERQMEGQEKKEAPQQQDVEAEEAGRRQSQDRHTEGVEETADGIEMQNLLPESDRAATPPTDIGDDMILNLSLRRSLRGSLQPPQASTGQESDTGQGTTGAMRLRALLIRIARERAAGSTNS